MLYNDSYIPSMADRHPAALGRPVAEVWGSAWDQIASPFLQAMATGRGFAQENVELPISGGAGPRSPTGSSPRPRSVARTEASPGC